MTIRLTIWCVGYLFLGTLALNGQERESTETRERRQPEAERAVREDQNQQREIEERLADMKRRIAELRGANKNDEAAAAEQDLRAFIAKSQNEITRKRTEVLGRQVEELRKAGRNDEAERLERQIRENLEREARARAAAIERDGDLRSRQRAERGDDRPDRGGPADLERRINVLRQAADNLMTVGLIEQAEQLRRQADAMRPRSGENPERGSELQELQNHLRQQNERIERLEEVVRRLAERIERQGAANNKEAENKRNDDGKKE